MKRILFAFLLTLFMFTSVSSQVTGKVTIPPTCFLTITKSGTGTGVVTGSPQGVTRTDLNCGAECVIEFLCGTIVTLTATPDGYDTFRGWSGGGTCTGMATVCSITLTTNTTVNAIFNLGVIFIAEGNFTGGAPGEQDYAVSRNVSNLVEINRVQLGNVGWGGIAHSPDIINVPTENSYATWNLTYNTPIDTGYQIFLQNGESGYFYIAGGSDGATWIFQKRQFPDGALIWERRQDFAGGVDQIHDLYYYNNNIYVTGIRFSAWLIFQKWTSGNVNVYNYEPAINIGIASGAAIFADGDGFVYVAYRNGANWIVEKRNDANPATVLWTQSTAAYGNQNPTKIRSDSTRNNIIVIGGNGSYIMEMRSRSEGTLLYNVVNARTGANNKIFNMTRVVNLGGENKFFTSGHDFPADYRARIEEIRESDFNLNQFITSSTSYGESAFGISTGSRANFDTVITGSMTYNAGTGRYDWLIQRRNADDLTP